MNPRLSKEETFVSQDLGWGPLDTTTIKLDARPCPISAVVEYKTLYPSHWVAGWSYTIPITDYVVVVTQPTERWLGIFPGVGYYTDDIWDDHHAPFRSAKTRKVNGVVVAKRKASFKSAFVAE